MFEFDGTLYTAAEMLQGNAHDDECCEFIRTAHPGDAYCGCTCVA